MTWQTLPFSKVVNIISGGTPKTTVNEYWGGEIPWLSVADFNHGYRWANTAEKKITDLGLRNSATQLLQPGQIIISARGTVGVVAQVALPMAFNQSCYGLTGKDGIDNNFLYYLTKTAVRELQHIGHGAVFNTITRETFDSINVKVPDSDTQKEIANILGTLDDKIDLNRRMNETLEAMARAIFKDWFVDFGPTRAKMEGRAPYLAPDLWALFPDRLGDDGLPVEWKMGKVGDVGEVICGKTPLTSVKEYYGEDIPFITIPDMHGKIFSINTGKYLSNTGAESQRKKTLPIGAICVSCIATPGLVSITTTPSQTNQQINSVVPQNADELYYWYWILKGLGEDIRQGGSGGSVLANLSTGRFVMLDALLAQNELRKQYHLTVMPFFEKILQNEKENHLLSSNRDMLLPKLMTGEVRVNGEATV